MDIDLGLYCLSKTFGVRVVKHGVNIIITVQPPFNLWEIGGPILSSAEIHAGMPKTSCFNKHADKVYLLLYINYVLSPKDKYFMYIYI